MGQPALRVAGDDACLEVVEQGGEELAFGAQGGLGGFALGDVDGHPREELAAGALVVQGKFIGKPVARAAAGRRD